MTVPNISSNIYFSIITAVKQGDLVTVKQLHNTFNQPYTCNLDALVQAIDEDNFTCDIEDLIYNPMYFAARNGDIECMQFLYNQGYEWHEMLTQVCAEYNYLECLKYAHQHGCSLYPDVAYTAAKHGHLQCYQYLYQHFRKISDDDVVIAVLKQRILIFRFCFEVCENKQNFWKSCYNTIIPLIDMDDAVWRQLLHIDLEQHEQLDAVVEKKKQEIKIQQDFLKVFTSSFISDDVLHYCVFPFI